MSRIWALCLAATVALGISGGAACGSEGFDDIAKLAKSGVAENILVAYVQASPIAYELTVDEILYLNDLGVTKETLQAVMDHGRDIRAGKAPVAADPVVAENDNAKPLDDVAAVDHTLDLPDPAVETTGGGDPNAPAQPAYFSPLTGQAGWTPEVIREKEIVRETVYVPTPVMAVEEATTSHFYETLTPYGTWVNINDTWCWQPSVVIGDPNWRPYCNRGHWVWSDCGWCWESDYSWGWAPFHYGRWWRANGYGWLWTPDTVWGPAWVNWRQNESHWGWAPLPPSARFETNVAVGLGFHFGGKHFGLDVGVGLDFGLNHNDYCFVPQNRFCDRSLNTYVVLDRDQRYNLYRGTTVIQNNITINKTTNNIFVNGPSNVLVQQRTGVTLRQFRIADNNVSGKVVVGSVEDRQAGVLSFYRPHVKAVVTETPVEIATRQLAKQNATIKPVADPRVLAASARADELRERNFATQDARRQEALLKQSSIIEEASARHSDNEQKRLNAAIGHENDAVKKAAFEKQLKDEQLKAQEARLQKESIDKQAVEQRKVANQLALERDRVARSQTTTESAKIAADTKTRLAAERAEREAVNKQAALQAEKTLADQRARNAALNNAAKGDAESRALAAEADRKARLDAERQAREANRKAQEDLLAKQKAQLEADRAARQKALLDKQNEHKAPKTGDVTPVNPNTGNAAAERAAKEAAAEKAAADRAAALKANREGNAAERAAEAKAARDAAAAREAAAEKAAAERAAAAKAARESARGQPAQPSLPINPKTGQPYDPKDPNDPNNPRKRN